MKKAIHCCHCGILVGYHTYTLCAVLCIECGQELLAQESGEE